MKMTLAAVLFLVCISSIAAQQSAAEKNDDKQSLPAQCPMHDEHAQMNMRGEKAMGFSLAATTHHFLLNASGGVIQVVANDSSDAQSRSEIRMHLGHIAKAFQNGDFEIPMFVHGTVPPGVPEMKRMQRSILYSFEETSEGARIVIISSEKDAIEAVHKFLRFQIEEHKTGDSLVVR